MCLQEMSKMDKSGSPRKWNKDYSFGDIDYKKNLLDDLDYYSGPEPKTKKKDKNEKSL